MFIASAKSIIFTLTLCSIVLAAHANDLSRGEEAYAQGDFKQALSLFDKVLSQQADNAVALYYRANTLTKLGLNTQALLDYEQAYKLAPSQTMRDYCLTAISSLQNNSGLPVLSQTSSSSHINKRGPKSFALSRSLDQIQLETALDRVRIVDTGELVAQDFTLKQQLKVAEMQRETERNLQQMRDAFYYDQFGNKQTTYSALQIQRYQQERQQEQEALAQSIKQNVQNQTLSSQRRAALTQQSANNLESQLAGGSLPDGVKLDPLGTNLYVRNYDITNKNECLPKPPVGLMAKEKQLQ